MIARRHGIRALRAAAIAFALIATAAGGAKAQEISETHLAAARGAVAASKATRSLDNILPDVAERIKQQLIANRPDAAEQISQIVDGVAISMAGRRGDLEGEIARGYARIFTEAELKVIDEFYNTDAGKKLIAETPVVARMMEQAGRVWQNGIQRDLQQEVTKKLREAGL